MLDLAEIDRQIELYRTRTADERREIVGLQPKRAEVILAGACIVRTVLEKLGRDSLTVSDRGLRHGLLVERFGERQWTRADDRPCRARDAAGTVAPAGRSRLALLLAMAMFVLVVDTSLMNVSISAVVHDLGTTVSGVQSAIALEALVSAAFILIGSKVGDLIGRKRAYVLGLLGYAVGALAMALAQSLTAVIIFWAIIGGLGASLLLPAMQSLIHGNFEGAAQKKAYALVGAAAAIAAAVGPLIGGFITTYLSWRVAFLLEDLVIAIVLSGIGLVRDVPYTGPRQIDFVGAVLSVVGMGGLVLGILVWQEGGEAVAELLALGAIAMGFAYWLVRRKREGKPTLIDPGLFSALFRYGISEQMLQQIALGGAMIALPIYLQMVFEYNAMEAGLSLAPLSLSMFGVALLRGEEGGQAAPCQHHPRRVRAPTIGMALADPDRSRGSLRLVPRDPTVVAGSGLGLLVSQLNNYTLSPISDERVSEGAGVNSAAARSGSRSGWRLPARSCWRRSPSASPTWPRRAPCFAGAAAADLGPARTRRGGHEQHAAGAAAQSRAGVQNEIISINTKARHRALQVALLIPLLAGLIGLFNSFRMMRLPDPRPASHTEGLALG